MDDNSPVYQYRSLLWSVAFKLQNSANNTFSVKFGGIYEVDLTQSIALVFGNEHLGVSDEVISLADGNFVIPQQGIIRSLNISVACAVTVYEAYRQKKIAGHYDQPSLPIDKRDLLFNEWGFDEADLNLMED